MKTTTLIGLKNGMIFEVEVSKVEIEKTIKEETGIISITKSDIDKIMRRLDGSKVRIDEVEIYTESIAFIATKNRK